MAPHTTWGSDQGPGPWPPFASSCLWSRAQCLSEQTASQPSARCSGYQAGAQRGPLEYTDPQVGGQDSQADRRHREQLGPWPAQPLAHPALPPPPATQSITSLPPPCSCELSKDRATSECQGPHRPDQRRVRVHVGPPSRKSYFGISRNSQKPETPQAGGTRQGRALFEFGLLRPAHI